MNDRQIKKFEEVKIFIKNINYELLQDYYIDNKTKIRLKCYEGHDCEISWGNLISGRRCKQCASEKSKIPVEQVINTVESEGYTFIREVKNSKERRIIVRCPNEHEEYEVSLNKFKLGRRCPKCKDTTFTYEFVKDFIETEGYKLLTPHYENVYQKLTLECPNGHTFGTQFHSFKNGGRRCRRCKSSKGEKQISSILTELDIGYITQKTFKDCKDKKVLPFDFYLPAYNLIIEYDGEQHFDIKHSYNKGNGFGETVYHDAIKNAYCDDNNINILRIPYWEYDNIEKLIKEKIEYLRKNFNDYEPQNREDCGEHLIIKMKI